MTLVEKLKNLVPELDISSGKIPGSVDKIKNLFKDQDLTFTLPKSLSRIVLVGGGSGTPTVGRSLMTIGISDFILIANNGEVQRDKETLKPVGAGQIIQEIPGAIDWIDIAKQSLLATPKEKWTPLHEVLDLKLDKYLRFGYLFFEALRQIFGDVQKAIDYTNYLLKNPYRVAPSSTDRVEVLYQLGDKKYNLYEYAFREEQRTLAEGILIEPPSHLSPAAKEVLAEAKVIIVGPGDVHFSVLPHWAVKGFREVLEENIAAKIILITNLTAREIDVPNFKLTDFLNLYHQYLPGNRKIQALVNSGLVSEENPLADDIVGENFQNFLLAREDIASQTLSSNQQVIHGERKLGRALKKHYLEE